METIPLTGRTRQVDPGVASTPDAGQFEKPVINPGGTFRQPPFPIDGGLPAETTKPKTAFFPLSGRRRTGSIPDSRANYWKLASFNIGSFLELFLPASTGKPNSDFRLGSAGTLPAVQDGPAEATGGQLALSKRTFAARTVGASAPQNNNAIFGVGQVGGPSYWTGDISGV